jgi:signal peptidase II
MSRYQNMFPFAFFLLLLGIDQLLKYTVRHLGGFYICNPDIAFGIRLPEYIFWIFWIAIVFFIFLIIIKNYQGKEVYPWLAILAGAMGNLIDRLFMDCVLDFINIQIWPIFNLADCFIVLGAIILIYRHWRKKS